MPDLGTNVPAESLQHMLDCKSGKHEVGNKFGEFSFHNHTYVHAQCRWCKNNYFARDGRAISREEYLKANDQFHEEIWK